MRDPARGSFVVAAADCGKRIAGSKVFIAPVLKQDDDKFQPLSSSVEFIIES